MGNLSDVVNSEPDSSKDVQGHCQRIASMVCVIRSAQRNEDAEYDDYDHEAVDLVSSQMNAGVIVKCPTLNSCRIPEFGPVQVVWILAIVEGARWIILKVCAVNEGWDENHKDMGQGWYSHQEYSSERVNS